MDVVKMSPQRPPGATNNNGGGGGGGSSNRSSSGAASATATTRTPNAAVTPANGGPMKMIGASSADACATIVNSLMHHRSVSFPD